MGQDRTIEEQVALLAQNMRKTIAVREALVVAVATIASEMDAVHSGSRRRIAQKLEEIAAERGRKDGPMKEELTRLADDILRGP